MKHTEAQLTKDVTDFLKAKYPKVLFKVDIGSDAKLSMFQAKRNKSLHGKLSRGHPDITIYKQNKYYAALFLELKVVCPYLKDGKTLKSSDHLKRQSEYHYLLQDEGYRALFVTGLKECISEIDSYMIDI